MRFKYIHVFCFYRFAAVSLAWIGVSSAVCSMCWNLQMHAAASATAYVHTTTVHDGLTGYRPLSRDKTEEARKKETRRRKYTQNLPNSVQIQCGWRVTPPNLCEPPAGTRMDPALFLHGRRKSTGTARLTLPCTLNTFHTWTPHVRVPKTPGRGAHRC